MTKERLEELIKQRAIIYDRETTKIMLDKYSHIYQDYLILGHSIGKQYEFYLRDLFETEEQALWAYKTVAERTERFEPPMWEDIDKEYEFNFLYRQLVRPGLYFVRHMRFTVYLYDNFNQICIFDVDDVHFKSFKGKATKENYIKACEIVRDLFNKENK